MHDGIGHMVHHPPWADTPRDTVNELAVRILLECILIFGVFNNVFRFFWGAFNKVSSFGAGLYLEPSALSIAYSALGRSAVFSTVSTETLGNTFRTQSSDVQQFFRCSVQRRLVVNSVLSTGTFNGFSDARCRDVEQYIPFSLLVQRFFRRSVQRRWAVHSVLNDVYFAT